VSLWNHPLCDDCWKARAGDQETTSGIWVRIEPGSLPYSPTADDT